MKNLMFLFMFLIGFEGYSQISLDFQSSILHLMPIKLSNTTTKYLDQDQWNMNFQNSFSLYNIDGTFYKTILLPPKPDTTAFFLGIGYITESLFDNDPSTIEYLVAYTYDSISSWTSNYLIKVIRDDGTILMDELHGANYIIYSTEEGTKLRIGYYYANGQGIQIKVFNLPGEIPTAVQDKQIETNNTFSIFPNPNNGTFFINFQSQDANHHLIDLYTNNGKLIETFKSSSDLTKISTTGLSNGLYLINTRTKSQNSFSKMIIKK
jgi:hypothetical protein